MAPDVDVGTLLSAGYFSRFLSVGAVGAVVDTAVLAVLVEFGVFEPVMASVVAKETSIATMFLLNDRWTFAESGDGSRVKTLRRFVRSNLVRAVGAGVGIAVLAALYYGLGVWYMLANVLGIGVGFVFNYTFESLITWQVALENEAT